MKNRYLLSTIVASCLYLNAGTIGNIVPPPSISQDSNETSNMFAPHEAIIIFDKNSPASSMVKTIQNLFGSNLKHNEYNIVNGMHIIVPGKSFDEIKTMLSRIPGVKSVEYNYKKMAFKSNDTYYDKLWAIENTGQSVNNKSGTKDADMDVAEAWNIEKGSSDVVVAVLDTGVDYTHEDLTNNMWNGNAHHGKDFAGNDDGDNDDDPMPDTPYDEKGHYHGTHVAGIIGAEGDNNSGVSGVAQKVQIMAVKVFRPNGYGYSSDILEGLDYVSQQIDNGVNVVAINASYGGGGGKPGDSMDQAIQKLGDKGVVFCAAAGNDGKNIDDEPVYPASYSATNIITVAASDQDDKLASFSNYGKDTVEVAAPGTNILNTYPENKYAYLQGTSMATPNVTGTVALLASVNPSSSVDDRIKAIINNIDKKSDLTDKVSTDGRVNTYKAVKSLQDNENQDPKAKDDSATTEYETKVTIDVLTNDSDEDGDTLTIKSVSTPSHGKAEIVNGKIEYTPNKGYSGEDSFSYTINDGNGGEAKATVKVTVKEKPNSAPIAKDDSAKTKENKTVTINVLANDSDEDGDTLTIKSITDPKNGVAKIKDNKIEYTPNKGYAGDDSFSYTIKDAKGAEANAKVSIKVETTPPTAKDDSATTEYETKVTIDVLANDSDEDGDTLTIKSVDTPSHGKAEIVNGKIEYTPNSGYSGDDSFSYTVSDGNGGEAKAMVNVKVKEKSDDNSNHTPIAQNDSATTEYQTKVTINVLENDSDIDGDTLTIKSVDTPKHGKVEIVNNKIEYTPENKFSGNDSFSYTVIDSKGAKAEAEVKVTVKEKQNSAPKANNDSVVTKYETKVLIDVLKNDSDEDGDTLTIKGVSTPSHGKAEIKNGKVEYTPNSGYSGDDNFSYTVSDGNGGEAKAVVNVKIQEKNDDSDSNHAPIAKDDSVSTDYETKVIIDVLANDSDEDGDTLTIKSVSSPSYGVAEIKNGKIEYRPNSDFSGSDSFNYTVEDENGATSSATVTVMVKANDDDNDSKKEYHFPVIGDNGVETVLKFFTNNFTESSSSGYKIFTLNNNQAEVKVDDNGEVEVSKIKAPIPKIKFSAGSKLEINDEKLSIEFKINKNISF